MEGLKEKLIIALAGNSALIKYDEKVRTVDASRGISTKQKIIYPKASAKMIVEMADEIINKLKESADVSE